jgi:hypothetical protein
MREEDLRAQIRGSHTEVALLAAEVAGGQIAHSGVIAALDGDEWAASDAAATLRNLGLASMAQSMASETTLTPLGRRIAQGVRRSRSVGPERWDRVQRAIIADLIQHRMRHADDWGVLDVDGQPVGEDERNNAMQKLADWGYLRGVSVAQADGFVRIDVTPKAAEVAGIDGLLEDFHSPSRGHSNSYHYNNSTTMGDGNVVGAVQTGGQGNSQTVTQSIDNSQRSELQRLLTGLYSEMDAADADVERLRLQVDDIRGEVESAQPSGDRLRTKINQALITAGASQGLAFALQWLAQMLGVLPPQ